MHEIVFAAVRFLRLRVRWRPGDCFSRSGAPPPIAGGVITKPE
jgi:hypothetical protein